MTAKSLQSANAQAIAAPLTQEALQTSLAMLQQVVDHLPQAIGWKNKEAVFLGCNQAFAQAVGLTHPDAIVGKAANEVQWHQRPSDFLYTRDRDLMAQQQAEYHQLEVLPDPEQPVYLDISHIPLCNEQGTIDGILSVIEDVTDTEATRRQSEATNRALINAVPDLLFRIRRDETYLDVQSSKSFTLLNADQLTIGTKVSNSLPLALAQQRMYYVQQALDTGELQIYEQELLIDGVLKHEEVRIVCCQTDEVVVMVRDITERKRSEAERKQAEAALRLSQFSIDHAADAIWWVEADGTIVYINDAGCRDLGLPRAAILGQRVLDFNPDFSAEGWADHWQNIKQKGSCTVESLNRRSDGIIYPIEVTINYIEFDGKEYHCAFVRNISDRKQAQKDLQLAQFSVEYASDSVLWIRPNAQIMYANQVACQSLGYAAEELQSLTVFEIDPAFPREAWADHWQQLQQQGSMTLESTHRTKDGRLYPVEVIVTYFAFEGEEYNFVRVRDITDRKQAEDALKMTQFSVDRAVDPVWWIEPDGKIFYINDAACNDLGYTREEILGKRVADLVPGFANEGWLEHWEQVRAQGSFTFEHQNQTKTGELYPVEVSVNYIELNGKEFNCVLVRNITDRKQAEAALRESEQQMREQADRERLLNRLLTRIRNSLDFDTILQTALQEVQAFTESDRCQFAWYDPNRTESYWEVMKETHDATLPSLINFYPISPASPLLVQLLDSQILRVEDAETLPESSLLRFVRRFHYRSMLAIPMRMQSGFLGTIFCCHSTEPRSWSDGDIELIQAVMAQLAIALMQADLYNQSRTKTRELEQALQTLQQTQTQMVQSEKMSSLGQLVAGVAHEINNPVNFIYGNLTHASHYTQDLLHLIKLYQQQYPNPTPAIQAEADAIDLDFLLDDLPKLLSSMKVGADRIQKIVLSLRNFSRTDEAEVKQVDIHEGIDSTLMILQSRLKGNGGKCEIAIVKNYGQLPYVECYPGQLNQVFMNILANAIDALEEAIDSGEWSAANAQALADGLAMDDRQPTIRIQTEQLDNHAIAIKIADNGCGMTQAQQQRLFDPFFTTKPVGKGTGLGLSISYQIVVEKHGGSLTCFSALGEGTTFCIEIPAGRSEG